MKDFIKQLFQDTNGKFSSKRFFAFISFGIAAALAFMKRDVALVSVFVGQATLLFGSTVAEKKK